MKVNVLSLSGLSISILTMLTFQPTLIVASPVDSSMMSSSSGDESPSQSLPTTLSALDERKADWAYDSWTMICADDRAFTFDCQAAHYYCDNDGYLRRQWENGRGDGGCPLFCQDEHDPLTLAARHDTISVATRTEQSTVATDDDAGIQLEEGHKIPGTPSSTIEPQVKPGSAPFVGGTVVPARSDAVKAAAGKWSSKVAGMLNGVRKLAVRVKARESVDHSTPGDIVESFEPQVKLGAPPPRTPLTSGSTKAMAGKWSQEIADVFGAVRKPTIDVEKRKGAPMVVATSLATRVSVPFWAKQVSAMLSSLNRLVE
ncbi:hypothetical protein LTR70_000272 [Exophiala xenobiotica]|nr:hypothetical protein LTR70_000272 [Exophiala xenobiotica]